MTITPIPIPAWDNDTLTGCYSPGRAYYSGPRPGQTAYVDKWVWHWFGTGWNVLPDNTFNNAANRRSAHAAVEDDIVHEYVSWRDTAYHSGVGTVNSESMSTEVSATPGHDATDATYESCSLYCVAKCRDMGRTVSSFRHLRHGDVYNTQCCGTVDVARIVRRALEIEASLSPQAVTASAPVRVPVIEHFEPFNADLAPSQTYSDEVKRMQKYLTLKVSPATGKPYFVDAGPQDGYYGSRTQAAVHAFQGQHGILNTSQYGWWYPLTRAAANADLAYPQTTNA